MTTATWVGVIVALFSANGIGGLWYVERVRRRSTLIEQGQTNTGQALSGFKDLVEDLQEERNALRTEIAALKVAHQAEIAALKVAHDAEIATLKASLRNRGHE